MLTPMEEEPPVNGPETPILMVSAARARPAYAEIAAETAKRVAGQINGLVINSLPNKKISRKAKLNITIEKCSRRVNFAAGEIYSMKLYGVVFLANIAIFNFTSVR